MAKESRPIIGGIFGTRTEVDAQGNVTEKDEFHLRIYWDFWRPEVQKVMKGNTCRVFLFIAMHMNKRGEGWPSQEYIAKRLGMARNTVSKCVDALVKAGYIEVSQKRGPDGKFGEPVYKLKQPLLDQAEAEEEDDAQPPVEDEENHSENEGEASPSDAQKLSNGDGLDGKPVDNPDPSLKNCARQTPSVAQKLSNGKKADKSRVSADAQKVSDGENPQKTRVSTVAQKLNGAVAQKLSSKEDINIGKEEYIYQDISNSEVGSFLQQQQREGEEVVVVDKLNERDTSFLRQRWKELFREPLTKNRLDQLVKAAADNWDITIVPPTSAGITTRILVVMENIRRYSKPHSPFAMVLRALQEGWTWDEPKKSQEPVPYRRTNYTPYNWVKDLKKEVIGEA